MDCIDHWDAKSQTQLSDFHFTSQFSPPLLLSISEVQVSLKHITLKSKQVISFSPFPLSYFMYIV